MTMEIQISDPVNESIQPKVVDFDEQWAQLGRDIKFMLSTYDPNVTWLNLHLSHDGKPGYNRTLNKM